MSVDQSLDFLDVVVAAPPAFLDATVASTIVSDNRQRRWMRRLRPAEPQQPDRSLPSSENVSENVPTRFCHMQPAPCLIVAALVVAYLPEPLATFLADGGYLPRGRAAHHAHSRTARTDRLPHRSHHHGGWNRRGDCA